MELHVDPEALEELLFMKEAGSGASFYLRSSFLFPQAP